MGAFDALDTVVESILALDYDALSAAERVVWMPGWNATCAGCRWPNRR